MRKTTIPQYAAGIARARLVKIACGGCKASTFAEVTAVPWKHVPGRGAEDEAVNKVYARCLRCGQLDGRSGDWIRVGYG